MPLQAAVMDMVKEFLKTIKPCLPVARLWRKNVNGYAEGASVFVSALLGTGVNGNPPKVTDLTKAMKQVKILEPEYFLDSEFT